MGLRTWTNIFFFKVDLLPWWKIGICQLNWFRFQLCCKIKRGFLLYPSSRPCISWALSFFIFPLSLLSLSAVFSFWISTSASQTTYQPSGSSSLFFCAVRHSIVSPTISGEIVNADRKCIAVCYFSMYFLWHLCHEPKLPWGKTSHHFSYS